MSGNSRAIIREVADRKRDHIGYVCKYVHSGIHLFIVVNFMYLRPVPDLLWL